MSTATKKRSFRDTVAEGLKLNMGHVKQTTEQRITLSDADLSAIAVLRESAQFKNCPREQFDRHTFRSLLTQVTTEPVGFCEKLSHKIVHLLDEGKLNQDLELDSTLTEGREAKADKSPVGLARYISEAIDGAAVEEGMGSSTTDDHEKMKDHGVALSSTSDRDEPKGDADKGTSQKGDHGKDAYADKGYQSEGAYEDKKKEEMKHDDDDKEKMKEGEGKTEMKGDDDKHMDEMGKHGDVSDKKPSYQNQMPDRKNGGMKEGSFDPADKQHNQPKGDDDKKGVNEDDTNEGGLPPELQKHKIDKGSDADGDGKTNEGKEPPKDAPLSTKPTAADSARYVHGKGQNESGEDNEDSQQENAYGNEGKGHEQGHKPKAQDPGTGSATTDGKKPETPDADTPNYSTSKVDKNDPSSDPKNKGPSSPSGMQEAFEQIEAKLVNMLEAQGLEPGTQEWNKMFVEGFQFALLDRAKVVAEAKLALEAKLAESRASA